MPKNIYRCQKVFQSWLLAIFQSTDPKKMWLAFLDSYKAFLGGFEAQQSDNFKGGRRTHFFTNAFSVYARTTDYSYSVARTTIFWS